MILSKKLIQPYQSKLCIENILSLSTVLLTSMYKFMFITYPSLYSRHPSAYAAPLPPKPRIDVQPKERKPDSNVRRNKLNILRIPFDAGYSRNCGGLGLTTYLLRFKYKDCIDQNVLDAQLLHK